MPALLGAGLLYAAEPFSVRETVRIPGAVLPAGSYTLETRDRLLDRVVLSVADSEGKVMSTFLAVPQTAGRAGKGLVVETSPGGSAFARGWDPGASGVLEFAYPKAEAAAIATETGKTVIAIDPESDKLPAANLSKGDMEIVTLWLLTPTRVGGETNLGAEKYATAKTKREAPMQAAAAQPTTLPSTAGNRALLGLLGGMALLGGLLIGTLYLAFAQRRGQSDSKA